MEGGKKDRSLCEREGGGGVFSIGKWGETR